MNVREVMSMCAATALCFAAASSAGAAAEPGTELAGGEERPTDERKKDEDKKVPDCVKVRTEARYRAYGYDHIVEIENTCDKAMACSVVTDVNDEPNELTVQPKETQAVITYRGSPARVFTANVSCKQAR